MPAPKQAGSFPCSSPEKHSRAHIGFPALNQARSYPWTDLTTLLSQHLGPARDEAGSHPASVPRQTRLSLPRGHGTHLGWGLPLGTVPCNAPESTSPSLHRPRLQQALAEAIGKCAFTHPSGAALNQSRSCPWALPQHVLLRPPLALGPEAVCVLPTVRPRETLLRAHLGPCTETGWAVPSFNHPGNTAEPASWSPR